MPGNDLGLLTVSIDERSIIRILPVGARKLDKSAKGIDFILVFDFNRVFDWLDVRIPCIQRPFGCLRAGLQLHYLREPWMVSYFLFHCCDIPTYIMGRSQT